MKTHLLVLIGVFLALLSGCGRSGPSATTAGDTEAPQKQPGPSTVQTNTPGDVPPKPDQKVASQGVSEAHRDVCIANLQQIGLAARVWSGDHKDHLPSDFPTLSDLMPVARLMCPDDPERTSKPLTSWAEFGVTNVSYQMVSPGVSEREERTVYVRCKYHGYILYANGRAVATRQ